MTDGPSVTKTIGPFPSLTDFVRSDIREPRPGLPLTLTVAVSGPRHAHEIAFPEDTTAQVYRTGVYASGGQNPTTNTAPA